METSASASATVTTTTAAASGAVTASATVTTSPVSIHVSMWNAYPKGNCHQCSIAGKCPDAPLIQEGFDAILSALAASRVGSRMGHITAHCRHPSVMMARLAQGITTPGAITQAGKCAWTWQLSNQCNFCPKLQTCEDRRIIAQGFNAVREAIRTVEGGSEEGLLIMDCRDPQFDK